MSIHYFLGRLMQRIGRALQSHAIMVMKPDDLIQLGRDIYSRPESVAEWGSKTAVDRGLLPEESNLFNQLSLKRGRMLLLGVGGGREAIPFAQAGFAVTGVDFIPGMVQKARENARLHGVELEGLVQNLADLQLSGSSYDVVWFSRAMYSTVPTRRRRLEMLRRITRALPPDGLVVCQFQWDPSIVISKRKLAVRRLLAWATLGNLEYEPGDMLWAETEFIHAFRTREELCGELAEAGFELVYWRIFDLWPCGGAIFHKSAAMDK